MKKIYSAIVVLLLVSMGVYLMKIQIHQPIPLSWSSIEDTGIPSVKTFEANSQFHEALKNSKFIKEEMNTLTEVKKIQKIMGWANKLWKHNGGNDPGTMDPTVILERASKGESFRCVEYSILTSAAAVASSLKARVVGLRTRDVETAETGAGHVVAEVFDRDLKKWIMVDSQWSLIPIVDGLPVNAYEFAKAFGDSKKIEFMNAKGDIAENSVYLNWIAPYLYYIAFRVDQRFGFNSENLDQIMLVPQGAKVPEKFQRNPIPGKVYPVFSPASLYGILD